MNVIITTIIIIDSNSEYAVRVFRADNLYFRDIIKFSIRNIFRSSSAGCISFATT